MLALIPFYVLLTTAALGMVFANVQGRSDGRMDRVMARIMGYSCGYIALFSVMALAIAR